MHGVTKAQMQKIQQSKETERTEQQDNTLLTEYRSGNDDITKQLNLNTQILHIASQNYQFWNERKEILSSLFKNADEEKNDEILNAELKLTEKLLPLNSKAYVVWYHRKWALNLLNKKDFETERKLCALMLKYDSRNCLFSFLIIIILSGHVLTPSYVISKKK